MLKVILFLLLFYGLANSQGTEKPCPQELLAKQRISIRKCDEYSNMMKKPVLYPPKPRCGWMNVSDCGGIGFEGMIVGGKDAAPKEFPHMAALGWISDDEYLVDHHCGGSLISEIFLLTAGHCLKSNKGPPHLVLLGDLDLSTNKELASPLEVPVKRVITHEKYDSRKNDIGLIEMTRKVKFNKNFIRPACLQHDEFSGDKVAATGWGLLKTDGETSSKLQKVGLPIQNMSRCRHDFDDEDLSEESLICAGGEKGKDTCNGDSGGPIQMPLDDLQCVYSVIGVTSYGTAWCAIGSAAIYTKVSHHIDWIESHVWPSEYNEWKERN